MSKYNFYKLKKDEHDWKIHTIPEGRKVPFKVMGQIAREDVEQVLNFALDMSYGDGHHRDHRQGGRHRRSNNEIFANTFQGKIAEYVVYYCLRQYGFEVEEPDLGVFGENIWDNVDIDCNGRHISIKSTKERGQLLLLEKGDWNDQGCYIPNINDGGKMAQYDYHMLVRVRPSCEDILRMNMHGLNKMLYHIVKRVPHAMCIYEAAYDYIDIENIEVDENRGNANSIYFTDGKHTYHFSRSKNTLYMIFDNMELMDEFEVQIYDDPYDILSNAMRLKTGAEKIIHKQEAGGLEDKKPCLCLRLYSTKQDGTKFVAEKSGLNQWNGVRSCYKKDKETGERIKVKETPRDVNELYIPYPSIDRNRGSFFPPRDTAFELRLPDGEWISAKVCQQDGKAIMSNPNNLLGKWLLRDVLELQEGTQITYEMLKEYGIDSVIFTKLDEGKYSIDFCELGTYEKVYGLEDIDAKNDVSDE